MTLKELLQQTDEVLAQHDIDESRLEAELLLRHLLQLDLTNFYVNLEHEVAGEKVQNLDTLVQRRTHGEPVAYITGVKEFFGIKLYVDHRVLIPRPETENLVEQALILAKTRLAPSCVIADIGTGCGTIAIALALNLPQAKIYATDISSAALDVAALNCQMQRVNKRVHLLQGDLLLPIPEPLNLIVANLPYVRDSDMAGLSPEIRLFEPASALAGGEDGLKWIKRLLLQAQGKLRQGGTILLEIAPSQKETVVNFASRLFPKAKPTIVSDLSGQERVIIIES